MANAVSDSLTISDTGHLRFQSTDAHLNIGCSQQGGNKWMKVLGKLTMTDGMLQVNGGIQFVSGSHFVQSGGLIALDPNMGSPDHSFQMAPLSDSFTHELPKAVLAFGGTDTSAQSLFKPFASGSVSATGGTIQWVDVNFSDSLAALFMGWPSTLPLSFDSGHTLIFGTTSAPAEDSSIANTFYFIGFLPSAGSDSLQFGSLILKKGNRPGRKMVISTPTDAVLRFGKKLELEPGAIIEVRPGMEVRIEKQ
jgi:hypothetical protein